MKKIYALKPINRLLMLGALIGLAITTNGQASQFAIGGNSTEILYSIEQTSTGGTILAGETGSSGAGSVDMFIVNLDASGNIIWSKTFGTSAVDRAYHAEQTANGGFIVTGKSNSYMVALRLDANGNITWSRRYGATHTGNVGHKIRETSDGNFVLVGETESYGAGLADAQILKLDANGVALWGVTYGDSYYDEAWDMVEASDGTYMITGHTYGMGLGGSYDVFLMKLTTGGTISWVQDYGGNDYESGYELQQTSDGGYIISGTTSTYGDGSNDMCLLKTSSTGSLTWSKAYGENTQDAGRGVQQTTDGGYILSGYTENFGAGLYDFALLKMDGSGNFTWGATFGGSNDESAYDVIQDVTGDYIIPGETQSFGEGGRDGYLVRTDANGLSTGCQQFQPLFTETSFTPNVGALTTIPTSTAGSGTDASYTVTAANYSPIFTNPAPTLSFSTTSPNCNGGLGSSDLTVSGGDGPYTYLWSSGSTAQDLINEVGGTYWVDVTDANGCLVSDTITITEPAALTASIIGTNVDCFGNATGEADLSVGGGTPPYTYLWSTTSTSQDLTGLTSGFYSVTVTDNNGCTAAANVNITEPTAMLSFITNSTNVDCFAACNGNATVGATGGTPAYSYQWDSGAGNQTTATATGLCAGTYTVIVTDGNGCTSTNNITITQPTAIITSTSTTDATCATGDGTATVTASGGTPAYTYSWSSGGTGTTETGLMGGNYTITVTDANGCTAQDNATVNLTGLSQDICMISVDTSSTKNVIMWAKPVATNIAGWNVYRDISSVYTLVGYVPYDSLSEFIDTTNGVNPNFTAYSYKITVVDTCGTEGNQSSYHKTMHLTTNTGTGNDINLIWSHYEGFGFGQYRIFRDTIGNNNFHVLDSVPSSNFTYTDPTGQSFNYINYIIEVVPPTTCVVTRAAGNNNSSRSNEAELVSGPNATPDLTINTPNLLLFPNPSKGQFNLEMNLEEAQNIAIEIYDLSGKLIHTQQYGIQEGVFRKAVNLIDFGSGMYYLRVIADNFSINKPFLLNK
jgi:hypothetical protein